MTPAVFVSSKYSDADKPAVCSVHVDDGLMSVPKESQENTKRDIIGDEDI